MLFVHRPLAVGRFQLSARAQEDRDGALDREGQGALFVRTFYINVFSVSCFSVKLFVHRFPCWYFFRERGARGGGRCSYETL